MCVRTNYQVIPAVAFRKKVLQEKKKSLVEFQTNWSGGSHLITPLLEKLADHYRDHLKFYCIDADEEKELSMEYNIRKLPTLLFFNRGQVVDRIIGMEERTEIIRKITHLLMLKHENHN